MHYERGLVLRKAPTDALPAHAETYCMHDSVDRIALVNLFCGLARKRNGEHGYADEQVLEKFFVKGAVGLTKIYSRADHPGVDALQFKVLKREAAVVNKALLKYSQSHTVSADRVCVSATYPIQSRRDQALFVAALKHNSLDDFLAPNVSLHFTTVTRITNTRTPPQLGSVAQEPDSPPWTPTSPTYSPSSEAAPAEAAPAEAAPNVAGEESEDEESSESENGEDDDTFEAQWASIQVAQVGAARHGQRAALRGFSDELFELKETMSDETFRALSNALKRRHDEI